MGSFLGGGSSSVQIMVSILPEGFCKILLTNQEIDTDGVTLYETTSVIFLSQIIFLVMECLM